MATLQFVLVLATQIVLFSLRDYYFILYTKSDVRKLWTNLDLSLGKTSFSTAISSLNIDPNGKIKIRGQTERPAWSPATHKVHILHTSNFIYLFVGYDCWVCIQIIHTYIHWSIPIHIRSLLEFNAPNSVLYLYLSFHKNNHCLKLCFLIKLLAITNRESYEG